MTQRSESRLSTQLSGQRKAEPVCTRRAIRSPGTIPNRQHHLTASTQSNESQARITPHVANRLPIQALTFAAVHPPLADVLTLAATGSPQAGQLDEVADV